MNSPLLQADCKRAVHDLTNLSNDELDKIMNDDEQIENILAGLDQVCICYTLSHLINVLQSYLKEIESKKEKLLSDNSTLAEDNLSREPELVEGREKLQQLSEEAEEFSKKVEEKVKQLSMLK